MNFIITTAPIIGADCIATKPATGRSYDCVISHDNYWLGFPHLYYPSNPHFAESLVRKAYEYRRNKNGKTLINTLKTQIANIFRVTRDFRMTLIVCFVIVLCIVCKLSGSKTYIEKNGKKIKVCTDCTFPHRPENYDKIIQILIRNNNN